MPSRLDAPVLTVDVGLIHKVDTRNVENLFSMWTVFSRCAGSLEEGRRLENLSWRLWNRETFCCEPGEANATTPAITINNRASQDRETADMPELSGSVDSLADEEAIEFESDQADSTGALDISHPKICRQDSVGSRSRGRERHITPDDLEKMVITIKEKKDLEPLEFGTHSYLAPLADSMRQSTEDIEAIATPEITSADQSSTAVSDSASHTSERSTTSIVRGFSPSHVSSSYRSIPLLSAPESAPKSALKPATRQQPKRNNMFALGASSGEESYNDSAMETHMQTQQAKKKAAMFKLGGSSGDDDSSLPTNMNSSSAQRSSLANSVNSLRRPLEPKKQTSFKEEVATRTIHEDTVLDDDVFEDTEDEDDIDESAIDDDDDSSEWEDSAEDSGKSSIDEKTFFQRVDSRPNLTSRRSLITTMLHQNDRASALQHAATYSAMPSMQRSRTSSPNGPSIACSPESDDAAPLMMRKGRPAQPEIPRSTAQPIQMTTTAPAHEAALSPKTTRRQMLSNELTQSLRRHLLWERQQKNQTATALKRRHTAHENLGNLKQFPEKVHMGAEEKDTESNSWNQYFGQGLGEYHSKGW